MAGAVVAIGNAPTALFHLLEMLRDGAPQPAAILGMPVGFVGAAESKDALVAEAPGALRHRARPARRQRHDRGRRQCPGAEELVVSANRAADRRRRRARRPGADDAEGGARAPRGGRRRPFRQGRPRRQCPHHRRRPHGARRDRAAAALSGHHRDPDQRPRAYAQRDRRLLRRVGRDRGAASRARAAPSPCSPRAIRCSTAPTCISISASATATRPRSSPASPACRAAGRRPGCRSPRATTC